LGLLSLILSIWREAAIWRINCKSFEEQKVISRIKKCLIASAQIAISNHDKKILLVFTTHNIIINNEINLEVIKLLNYCKFFIK